jgi:hypothetical protein
VAVPDNAKMAKAIRANLLRLLDLKALDLTGVLLSPPKVGMPLDAGS